MATKQSGDTPAKAAKKQGKTLKTNDIVAQQASASEGLVAAMPHNSNKEFEHGHANALAPMPGTTVTPDSDEITASTATEQDGSTKTGHAAPAGSSTSGFAGASPGGCQ